MTVQVVHSVLAAMLLVAVLVCVVWRPRGLNVAWPATVGAVLAVVVGLVQVRTLRVIVTDTWDASATLIALFLLSEALNANGFFTWAALHLARFAGGSGWRLYVLIIGLTTGTTALLANDGAVLILTPIVATLLVKIYRKEATWLPFVFAAGFLADATSGLFLPSNLTNIILADANHLSFAAFVRWMFVPTLLVGVVAGLCFGLRFRLQLRERYDVGVLAEPRTVVRDGVVFWCGWGALLLLVVGYIVGGELHLPVSFISVPVALGLVLLVQVRRVNSAKSILWRAPWSILLYALGMFVVITAAYTTHVLAFVTVPLQGFVAETAGFWGAIKAGGMLALLSAGTNNLPATLIGVLVLRSVAHANPLAIYALVLGVDIGPKLTPFGSLATLLWLGILERHEVRISWGRYVQENWWVTVLALLVAFLGLFVVAVFFVQS